MDKTRLSMDSIDQACLWMARLWADDVTEQDHQDCYAWRRADPANEAAWQQVQHIRTRFETMPDRQSASQLLRQRKGITRRQLLGFAGLGLGVSLIGVEQVVPNLFTHADYVTATGQISDYVLADGTRLVLNTASQVDVEINESKREIRLLAGEIWLATGQHHLPLTVVTKNGTMQPLGTEFCVRQFEKITRLSVYQGSVQIMPAKAMATSRVIESGEGTDFTPSFIETTFAAQADNIAWIQGKLVAKEMPLTDFISELSRYRTGVLRASAELKQQTVTGVFSLNAPDKVLHQLTEILPIDVQRFSPWWVNIVPV